MLLSPKKTHVAVSILGVKGHYGILKRSIIEFVMCKKNLLLPEDKCVYVTVTAVLRKYKHISVSRLCINGNEKLSVKSLPYTSFIQCIVHPAYIHANIFYSVSQLWITDFVTSPLPPPSPTSPVF